MSALLPLRYCLEKGGKFLQSVKYACETKTIWIDLSDDPIDDAVTGD